MSSENDNHAVLVEALEAGGYAPAAISNARVAASRGLGARTTRELVEAADPAAGKIAAAIFGSEDASKATPAAAMAPDQELGAAMQQLDADLHAAVFGQEARGDA
jgi:hypothetical protein